MAEPTTPIIPGHDLPVTTYAENQPEYIPLPVFRLPDGTVLSRWKLNWKERLIAFLWGDVYLFQSTFYQPLQPVRVQIHRPPVNKDEG